MPGYLYCDGSEVSRISYSKLFEEIGTIYGSGDGSTTFNLPDFRGRFIEFGLDSENVGSKKEAGLPNITGTTYHGSYYLYENNNYVDSGAFSNEKAITNAGLYVSSGGGSNWVSFDASRSSPIYGNSETVQPNSIIARAFIKY